MIDPRISLGLQVPNSAQAINIFENALMNSQKRELAQAQEQRTQELAPFKLQQAQQGVDINAQTLNQNRDTQRLQNLHVTGQRLKPLIESGNIQAAQQFMLDNISGLQSRIEAGENLDITESMETLDKLQTGDVQGVLGDINAVSGLVGGGQQKRFAAQQSKQFTDPVTGQVSNVVFDPNTQQTTLQPILGAIGQTSAQETASEFKAAERLANLDVETTKRKETIKKTVARTSQLKAEYSTKRRQAANSARKVREAQKLAENATQGLAGVSKVQLGKVFPGIDVSDEAGLSSAFKSLALDELQKFKGPTTDFEFAVTEDIAGSLGSGAEANRARLASLGRASWFANREAGQWDAHEKAGHDPDKFQFNFNELVTPKKGGPSYSLQDLQDTAVANHLSIDDVIKRLSN